MADTAIVTPNDGLHSICDPHVRLDGVPGVRRLPCQRSLFLLCPFSGRQPAQPGTTTLDRALPADRQGQAPRTLPAIRSASLTVL